MSEHVPGKRQEAMDSRAALTKQRRQIYGGSTSGAVSDAVSDAVST